MLDGLAEDRVRVSATARRAVPADRAVWTLAVAEAGEVPAETFERCGERLDALTRALRSALADTAEIRTGAVTVRAQHDDHGRPTARVDASGQVVVDVPLAEAGRAAGAAMAAGADRLNGPALVVRDPGAIEEELLSDAVAIARRKAERLAAAAGRPLGGVVSVSSDLDEDGHPHAVYAMAAAGGYEGPELAPSDTQIAVTIRAVFAFAD
jgi:uncharacterized protein YggE